MLWLRMTFAPVLLLLYVLAAGTAPASAAEDAEVPRAGSTQDAEEPYGMQGVQVALGGHYAVEDFSRGEVVSADDSAGVSARIGFRIHPNLSVDGTIDFSTGFDVTSPPDNSTSSDDDTIETGAFCVAARGILPFGRFQPYLSLGLGAIVVDTNKAGSEEVDVAGRFVGGIDIYVTRFLGVNLRSGYMLPLGHLNGYKHAMVGGGLFVLY